MAVFCLDCYIKICKRTDGNPAAVKLSDYEDYCEICGVEKHVVVDDFDPFRINELNEKLYKLAIDFGFGHDKAFFHNSKFYQKSALDFLKEDRVSKAEKLAVKLLLCLYWGGPRPDQDVTFDPTEAVKCWEPRMIKIFEEWVKSNNPIGEE